MDEYPLNSQCVFPIKPFWKFPDRHTKGCVFMEILIHARTAMMSDFHRHRRSQTDVIFLRTHFLS